MRRAGAPACARGHVRAAARPAGVGVPRRLAVTVAVCWWRGERRDGSVAGSAAQAVCACLRVAVGCPWARVGSELSVFVSQVRDDS